MKRRRTGTLALAAALLVVSAGCSYRTLDTGLAAVFELALLDLDDDGDVDVAASDGGVVGEDNRGFVTVIINESTYDAEGRSSFTFRPPESQALPSVERFDDVTGDGLPDAVLRGYASNDCPEPPADVASPASASAAVAVGRARFFGACIDSGVGRDAVAADFVRDDGAAGDAHDDGADAREVVFSRDGTLWLARSTFAGLDAPSAVPDPDALPATPPAPLPARRVLDARDFDGDGRADALFETDDEDEEGAAVRRVAVATFAAGGTVPRVIETDLRAGDDCRPSPELGRTRALAGCLARALGDLDGDGDVDAVQTLGDGTPRAQLFLNDGDGALTAGAVVELGDGFAENTATIEVVIVDYDGDGNVDIAALHEPEFGLPNGSVAIGKPDGKGDVEFSPRLEREDFLSVSRLAVGDLDGDGRDDLAAATDAGKLRVYLAGVPR